MPNENQELIDTMRELTAALRGFESVEEIPEPQPVCHTPMRSRRGWTAIWSHACPIQRGDESNRTGQAT